MYTNGIDITECLNALEKRIGWEQSTKSDAPVLSIENLDSISGRFFQDFHPLVTPENIKAAQDNPMITDDQLNEYLIKRVRSSITNVLSSVFDKNSIIEQSLVYKRIGQNDLLINNSDLFVGYEINVANNNKKKVQITGCTIYLDSEVNFNLYLFEDGNPGSILTKEVTSSPGKLTKIKLDNVYLPYSANGKYFFGYFQSDIGDAKAYLENVYCKKPAYCYSAESMYSKSSVTDFDRNNICYPSQPYGLNLEITSFNDVTETILSNPAMFDDLIGMSITIWALELLINNSRSNRTERITKEQASIIYQDLNMVTTEQNPFNVGLRTRMEREMKKVKQFFNEKPKAISDERC
jgi:hypothetical protein